ncbi:hypothetical protein Tco_0000788 [Tanacetum coccineum]
MLCTWNHRESSTHIYQKEWIYDGQGEGSSYFSDYDVEIRYHPGKATVVADALSRKERVKPKRVRAMTMTIQSGVKGMILAAQVDTIGQKSANLLAYLKIIVRKENGDGCTPMKIGQRVIGGAYVIMSKLEGSLIGLELVQKMTDKVVVIKERLQATRDSQKSYADNRRKQLEFEVGDRVMLKVSPWKGGVRFGKKGKLAPRYVGPFEILERIGSVAYRLRLPEELSGVHDTFHVSNLKKCLADASLHVSLNETKVDKTLHFVEEPIEIIDHEIKSLKRSKISLVKGGSPAGIHGLFSGRAHRAALSPETSSSSTSSSSSSDSTSHTSESSFTASLHGGHNAQTMLHLHLLHLLDPLKRGVGLQQHLFHLQFTLHEPYHQLELTSYHLTRDIEAKTVAAATKVVATIDGLDIKMGFKPGLAVVESESEPEEAEANDEADAEIQPEGTIEIEVDITIGIDIPHDLPMPYTIERLEQLEESVQGRVAALKGSNTRLRDTLGIERVRELRADKSQKLWRMETFLMRTHDYRP